MIQSYCLVLLTYESCPLTVISLTDIWFFNYVIIFHVTVSSLCGVLLSNVCLNVVDFPA